MLKLYNFNTVAALIFILLSVVLFFIIPYQIDKPLIQLGGVGQSHLSAELFPTIVAISLFLLGLWYFFMSFGIKQKNKFIGHIFAGKYLDCGSMSGYINSSLQISKY